MSTFKSRIDVWRDKNELEINFPSNSMLPSRVLSKYEKPTTQKTRILPVLCICVKLGGPTLGQEPRVTVFQNRALRRIVGPKWREVTAGGKNSTVKSFIICVPQRAIYRIKDINGARNTHGKANPVTGRRGPQGCDTSRLPHFLDNRLTDGDEVVSLTRRTPFTARKIPGTHFC
jgi:hypothetical protein